MDVNKEKLFAIDALLSSSSESSQDESDEDILKFIKSKEDKLVRQKIQECLEVVEFTQEIARENSLQTHVYLKTLANSDLYLRSSAAAEEHKHLGNGSLKAIPSSTVPFGYHQPHLHIVPEHLPPRSPSDLASTLYAANARRQRGEKKPIPDEQKDDKYFERRRRNNQAAKKSRDARKMREDQVALRATILEHENAILRAQVLTLREEASSLRQLLLQKKTLEIASRDPQICSS